MNWPYWMSEGERRALVSVAKLVSHKKVRQLIINIKDVIEDTKTGGWTYQEMRALASLLGVLSRRILVVVAQEESCEQTEEDDGSETL